MLRKNICLLLLAVSLLSINGSEFFHSHNDSIIKEEQNCYACLIKHVLSSSDLQETAVKINSPHSELLPITQNHSLPSSQPINKHSVRAPPELSHNQI